ncbi:filamin-A-interacting protein 1-like isoform X2 [Acipenser ruthenus]|uniref:filamin-A-interacting protein 1-like isoform X2 n=1 Tax=Acipenser ruthenus TaxID=7906 RepID=UPI0027404B5A|nr:filamin-A-interacting protein 1-like isoform X2 [Acipenser ruthenus]
MPRNFWKTVAVAVVGMRSRSNGVESPPNGQICISQPNRNLEEDEGSSQGSKKKKNKSRQQKEGEVMVSGTVKRQLKTLEDSVQNNKLLELSKDDLLRLLGIMEGEVQAREDIIHMLKTERTKPEVLEAQYGSSVPDKALRALHRDAVLTKATSIGDDVYETPMAELDRLEDKHRETYRRMLEQLLLAEKCHRRTVNELENEKRKHNDYMNKSDDFTNLLEQERERLKRLLEQEKAYQTRKEKEHNKRLNKVREELVKLKSFALMLVDERQIHIEQIDQQTQKVQDLSQKLQEKEQKLKAANSKTKEDCQKILKLETNLEHKSIKFVQEHEEMTAKLANQESQNHQLRLKLAGLTRRIEELEETNKVLQKAEEELQKLRNKISTGGSGNSSLMTEVENLRKRVLEMEGKDEEITKTESQCRELKKKLQEEENHSKELKHEVEKLQKRMVELEKLEGAFSVSKSECTQLHASLEKEKSLSKDLINELEVVKAQVKDLEALELRLEKTELSLKDDLTKLKSFTVMLVDERKNMSEKLKQEEKKANGLNQMVKTEQSKVMEVTEKLIEESKRLLKLKSEMEEKMSGLTKEKEELQINLRNEEEKSNDLNCKVGLMKKRLDTLEEAEREAARSRAKKEFGRHTEATGQEDNKVTELTLEIERLKNRLKQLEVVEGDLMKTEDEYDLLDKKFRTEHDKANLLSQQLEEMKSQIARNKAIEKGEAVSQEAELRQRYKMEEVKTRDLQADVQALKEKIHELMNKEDQLSQLQVDYSVLQKRFIEEENKKKNMSVEVLNLTKELEITKRYSRALRPSMNGRRMVDVPVTSTGVQTDSVANETAEEDTPAVFIRKSVQEENHIMSNLRQKGLKKPMERPAVLDRYPPATSELSMRKSWIPWMKKKEHGPQSVPEKATQTNGNSARAEVVVSQKQGQPLHIRVTPNHEHSTATLEITSPTSEDFFSSATVIPTLGLQKPRITIIPTPSASSQKSKTGETLWSAERAMSPVTITTTSKGKSPETGKTPFTDRPLSPIQMMTVFTSAASDVSVSPEPQEMTMGRAVFKVTPEKQTVPTPIRKYSSNANIITTEDNKIHIHLGPQFKRSSTASSENPNPTITVRPVTVTTENNEVTTGTVLRSPRHNTAPKTGTSKMTSSITITAVSTASTRPTQSVPGQEGPPARPAPTRIPMTKGMKAGKPVLGAMGAANMAKLESRSDSQSMKIEVKKSVVSSSNPLAGGKG